MSFHTGIAQSISLNHEPLDHCDLDILFQRKHFIVYYQGSIKRDAFLAQYLEQICAAYDMFSMSMNHC